MKKIQITTVTKQANIEVIELNSSFVAKAVRAADTAKYLKEHIESDSKRYELDENGDKKLDENGKPVEILEVGKSCIYLQDVEVVDVYNRLLPFVEELCTALLGEEK